MPDFPLIFLHFAMLRPSAFSLISITPLAADAMPMLRDARRFLPLRCLPRRCCRFRAARFAFYMLALPPDAAADTQALLPLMPLHADTPRAARMRLCGICRAALRRARMLIRCAFMRAAHALAHAGACMRALPRDTQISAPLCHDADTAPCAMQRKMRYAAL